MKLYDPATGKQFEIQRGLPQRLLQRNWMLPKPRTKRRATFKTSEVMHESQVKAREKARLLQCQVYLQPKDERPSEPDAVYRTFNEKMTYTAKIENSEDLSTDHNAECTTTPNGAQKNKIEITESLKVDHTAQNCHPSQCNLEDSNKSILPHANREKITDEAIGCTNDDGTGHEATPVEPEHDRLSGDTTSEKLTRWIVRDGGLRRRASLCYVWHRFQKSC